MSKTVNTINENESVRIATIGRGTGNEMYAATICVAGDFDNGTIALEFSPNSGVTKIPLKGEDGNVIAITSNDVLNGFFGFAGVNGSEPEIYATMSGSSEATTDVTVTVFDNK